MEDELYDDMFHFELPVWILIHQDDVYAAGDGRERIRLPGRIETSSTPEGRLVCVYTDQDLAQRSLKEGHGPDVRAAAILTHDDFKRFLKFVLEADISYLGIDAGKIKTTLIEIEPFLKRFD